MASVQTDRQKVFSRVKVESEFFEASSPVAEEYVFSTWLSLDAYEYIGAYLKTVTVGSGSEVFAIYAATDNSGSDAAKIVERSTPEEANTAGDVILLEMGLEQLHEESATTNWTHFNVAVKPQDESDEYIVTVLQMTPWHSEADLTSENIQ